jgi:hypothetical protein
MQLKRYSLVPSPTVLLGQITPMPDAEDIVLSVKRCSEPKDLLRLSLRNRLGREFTVEFLVPEALQEPIIFSILRKKDMTWGEVGELPVEEPAFVEPVIAASQFSSLPESPDKQTRRTRLYAALRLWFAYG